MKETGRLSELPPPLAVGRSAEIYPWEEDRILKLFFQNTSQGDIEQEYRNTSEAAASGVTGMACHGRIRIETRSGIILDRIDGVSLTRMPEKNPLHFFSLPGTLADLHLRLHTSRTHAMEEIRAFCIDMLDSAPLAFLTHDEKARAQARILALPEGEAILHMDFHPENILVSGRDCTLIDWMTAVRGNPAADVAATVFLLKDAELWPGISKPKKLFYEIVRRFILNRYLHRYLSRSHMTMADILAWRLPVLLLRLRLWDIASEREQLKTEIQTILSGDPT